MIFAAILILAAEVGAAVASPAAPWWAESMERVLIEWGRALIVAFVPLSGTVVRGIISHREHVKNLEAVREAVVGRDEIKTAIAQVHEEVRTSNALKLGEMADDAESRRIGNLPAADRTDEEQAHIDQIPDKSRKP